MGRLETEDASFGRALLEAQPIRNYHPSVLMLGANWAIPDAEVNFKVMDTQWGNIVCGRSRSRIAGMSREGYPELPLGKRGRWAEAFSVQEALHRARLRVYPANHPILIGSLDAYGAMQVPQRSRVQRRNSRLDHKAR